MLTALAFAVGGFLVGKSKAPLAKDDPIPSDPAAIISPAAEAAPLQQPEEVADLPPRHDPQSSLQAFLDAPTWKERAKHVLWPGEVKLAMMKHAADFGDGPIKADSITLLEVNGPNHIFKVCTSRIPEGYPVAVSATDEGPMVDWEAFIGFHDDQFKEFIEGPTGRSGIFDLLIKPDPDETEAGNYIRYILSVPMPDRETTVYIRKDSLASGRLLALFAGAAGFDEGVIEKLKETGAPVVLAVAKRHTDDGRSYFEIEDLVAVGWEPASP